MIDGSKLDLEYWLQLIDLRTVIPLRCCVKKYEWGKKGMDSAVARFVKNQMPGYDVDPDSPHAEVI